jgi:hypothetical protein
MFSPTSKLKPCAFLAPAEEPVAETESTEGSDVSVDEE